MNHLARREVAIVSPHAGTTRDVIELHLDLDGCPVTVIDTAGIRDTDDPVEQEGVRRAKACAAAADLVLWLADVDREQHELALERAPAVWLVRNKIDVAPPKFDEANPRQHADRDVYAAGSRFLQRGVTGCRNWSPR